MLSHEVTNGTLLGYDGRLLIRGNAFGGVNGKDVLHRPLPHGCRCRPLRRSPPRTVTAYPNDPVYLRHGVISPIGALAGAHPH